METLQIKRKLKKKLRDQKVCLTTADHASTNGKFLLNVYTVLCFGKNARKGEEANVLN